MIRIVDEPIFTMTKEEFLLLEQEYFAMDGDGYYDFEEWLRLHKHMPYTTYREENP